MAVLVSVSFALGIVGAMALTLALILRWVRHYADSPRPQHHDSDLVEALPFAVALFSADDRLILANTKLSQLMPAVEELRGRDISRSDFFQTLAETGIFVDASHRLPAFLADVAARAEPRQIEWEVSLTDGRSLHFNERATDGGGRLLTCVDITQQKQQSWALDEKSHLLRASLESIDQGVLVFGPDGRMRTWNERYFDLFGVASDIAEVGLSVKKLCWYLADADTLEDNSADAVSRRIENIMNCDPAQEELQGPE
ncbi:MAG: PAS-domain containing protein, partial [Alphaproteobacteria bacterium]|nr:PAS-domain containing protein [Alphaproteobacteria bacterium]